MASLLIDDDGLVATAAAGKVVSGRLFVHDGNAMSIFVDVDAADVKMDDGSTFCTGRGKILQMIAIVNTTK